MIHFTNQKKIVLSLNKLLIKKNMNFFAKYFFFFKYLPIPPTSLTTQP